MHRDKVRCFYSQLASKIISSSIGINSPSKRPVPEVFASLCHSLVMLPIAAAFAFEMNLKYEQLFSYSSGMESLMFLQRKLHGRIKRRGMTDIQG